jgi:phosphate/sulfate permease
VVKKSTLWIIGAVLLVCLLLGLLPMLLDLVQGIVWLFVIVPVVGTVLGLFIAAIIHRYILPSGSRHRGSSTVTLYTVGASWLVVLLSSC